MKFCWLGKRARRLKALEFPVGLGFTVGSSPEVFVGVDGSHSGIDERPHMSSRCL